jgi:hypothetical protein
MFKKVRNRQGDTNNEMAVWGFGFLFEPPPDYPGSRYRNTPKPLVHAAPEAHFGRLFSTRVKPPVNEKSYALIGRNSAF